MNVTQPLPEFEPVRCVFHSERSRDSDGFRIVRGKEISKTDNPVLRGNEIACVSAGHSPKLSGSRGRMATKI
jgi:hypothetical protein